MSETGALIFFLFAKIDEQKNIRRVVAGYSCEQTVFQTDCFCYFLIVS